MAGLASQSQLRQSFLRYALITVPGLILIGSLVSALSNSGYDNAWFAALAKPGFMPPGWAFGLAWTILYALLGLSLAMILHAKGAKQRSRALILFAVQLALNYAWPPVFFAMHQVGPALMIIAAMIGGTFALILVAWRIRVLAGLFLYPYLAWLMFAGLLNYEIMRLNPNAAALEPGPRTINIDLNRI